MNEELELQEPIETTVEIDSPEDSEPSLLDKLYAGEINYEELDPSTKKSIKKEWVSGLDDHKRYLHENGWVDKPLFVGKDRNGNPIDWKTAEEFERILGRPKVAKERESHLVEELRRSKDEIEKLKQLTKFSAERSLKSEEAQIDVEIAAAREYGDIDAFERAQAKKIALEQSKSQVQGFYQEPVQTGNVLDNLNPEDRQSFLDFKTEIPMLGTDIAVSKFVEAKWNEVQNANSLTFDQKLNYIKRTTTAAFPSKFATKTNNFMPTSTNTNNSTVKTTPSNVNTVFNSLPERDKVRVSNLIASGKYSSKEDVLKSFGLIKK